MMIPWIVSNVARVGAGGGSGHPVSVKPSMARIEHHLSALLELNPLLRNTSL